MVFKKTEKTGAGGFLDDIGELSGLLNDTPEVAGSGLLELSLAAIDEDPNQPRSENNPGFSKSSLDELAATIAIRGVKSPISVRENPEIAGRYIINHGARRYRASKIVKKETIPAFIDNDYNEADQVIENLQRNELTAREVADYIGRELAKGNRKSDIATAIGKSAAFVSQHVTLLDLPDPIAVAFNSGRGNDVTVVNELVKAYKKDPEEVIVWLNDEEQELTRGSVKILREYLDVKGKKNGYEPEISETEDEIQTEIADDAKTKKREKAIEDPDRFKKAIVAITHDHRPGRLMLNRRPSKEGQAWVKYDDDGHEFETELEGIQLVAILEG